MQTQKGDDLFESLKGIVGEFNAKWENTGTWSFSLSVFRTPEEVGKEVVNRYQDESEDEFQDKFDLSKDEWLEIYQNVYENNNQNRFKNVLKACLIC